MEENITYGFFDQIPIAFFQPHKYKYLLGKKKRYIAGFIALIVTLILLMDYVIPFVAWDVSVGGIEHLVVEGIPQFTLKNGVFQIESPLDIEVSGMIHLKADSGVKQYKKEDLQDKYVEEFLISENNVMLRHSNMVYEIKFSEMTDLEMNNESLVEMLPMLKTSAYITLGLLFIIQLGYYILSAAFFAFLCSFRIRGANNKKIRFPEAFVFAVYARALFALITSINACLGFPLDSTLVLLVGVYFTMRWIFNAERSYLGITQKNRRDADDDQYE